MTLKLGSNVVGTIKLGSTRVSMIKLGSTTIYPTSAPPGGTLLLNFEDLPSGSPFTNSACAPVFTTVQWGDLAAQPMTVTRTTSHVTQGTYSWRIQGSAGGYPTVSSDSQDISAYITSAGMFEIDVYTATINASDYVYFTASDGLSAPEVFSSAGQSGAFTLSLDVSSFSSFTSVNWQVLGLGSLAFDPLNGNIDYYVDNLRAS